MNCYTFNALFLQYDILRPVWTKTTTNWVTALKIQILLVSTLLKSTIINIVIITISSICRGNEEKSDQLLPERVIDRWQRNEITVINTITQRIMNPSSTSSTSLSALDMCLRVAWSALLKSAMGGVTHIFWSERCFQPSDGVRMCVCGAERRESWFWSLPLPPRAFKRPSGTSDNYNN